MIHSICHLTSAHTEKDVRIFLKECCSLSKEYKVSFIVPGIIDHTENNIELIGIKKGTSRLKRMFLTSYHVYKKALTINAELYHFHDPELLWVGWLLARKNKKVIYDAHENISKQILGKYYIPLIFRKLLSKSILIVEKYFSKRFSGIITATDSITQHLKSFNNNTITINNYPLLEEVLVPEELQHNSIEKRLQICYMGGLTEIRGLRNLVKAMEMVKTNCTLVLAGSFSPSSFFDELKLMEGWKKVNYLGHLSRNEVFKVMAESNAGVIPFLPVPNHVDAQPNKMFEYMSAGIPVIASNFPLWSEILVDNKCGFLFNPNEPSEIAETIDKIFQDAEKAKTFGENGKKLVVQKYNWEVESIKLLNFYRSLFL